MLTLGRAVLAAPRSLGRRGYAMSSEVATGINILKNGSDPQLKEDEELPEWLWELAQPEKPLSDLQRHSFEELSYEEQCRWVKLENRSSIKATNVLKGK